MKYAVVLLLLSSAVWADELQDAQRAQVELLRAEIASQTQLRAFELLDELVYGWLKEPPFSVATPTVLADVTVPVGLSTGLHAQVENHLVALLTKNPRVNVQLVHCPTCTAWVFHAGKQGSIVSRGFERPDALKQAGIVSGSRHALFLDFEAEGASLVLRVRVTSLEPSLPIVFARTLSSATSAPALLRSQERLTSAEDARTEYIDALAGRGPVTVPLRLGVRTYASNPDMGVQLTPAPFIWLQGGAEVAFSSNKAWLASATLGISWAPQSHVGFLAHARLLRLIGTSSSLTAPDVYIFGGGSVLFFSGSNSLIFREGRPTIDDVLASQRGGTPTATLGAITLGLEVRMKQRLGLSVFAESLPYLDVAQAIGSYINLGIVRFHSLGVEVNFWF
jgi:hypothetical protein